MRRTRRRRRTVSRAATRPASLTRGSVSSWYSCTASASSRSIGSAIAVLLSQRAELVGDGGAAAMQPGLHRALGDPLLAGDLRHGELADVVEDEDPALPLRQGGQHPYQRDPVRVRTGHVFGPLPQQERGGRALPAPLADRQVPRDPTHPRDGLII